MKKQTPQLVAEAKGRPMLKWVGKKPLSHIDYYPAQEKEVYGNKKAKDFNKLFWGDNLQVLSHLLKEYRGKVDLVYIDPPFDSKADYIKKVKFRGQKLEGKQQTLLEEKQYTDIWEKDEYLQFMYERLQLLRELLADTGSIYLHCDWHKSHYLRLILDEVFGESNFQNEIVIHYTAVGLKAKSKKFHQNTESVFYYVKSKTTPAIHTYSEVYEKLDKPRKASKHKWNESLGKAERVRDKNGKIEYFDVYENKVDNFIEVSAIRGDSKTNYPTQKSNLILERIIKASSNPGDLVLDCFMGSGTTLAVAQELGRRWIGCDINTGAIQTTTKRLNQILSEQQNNSKETANKSGLDAFKIYNVNDYDLFKNELEAKQIVMDTYGVEPTRQAFFDGLLDSNLVKVMPLNRVLNKQDIELVFKAIKDKLDRFTPKPQSKSGESVYQEKIILICSGAELDIDDYLKRQNKTGVDIEVWDIQRDKTHLTFKRKPEAEIKTELKDNLLSVEVLDFHSPLLMQRLSANNKDAIKPDARTLVEDFKQIIDSVAVDVDWDGDLFNAEIIDTPTKKEVVKAQYQYEFSATVKKTTIAIKITDVLGDEFFTTIDVAQK
jgi:DNA modification methylase